MRMKQLKANRPAPRVLVASTGKFVLEKNSGLVPMGETQKRSKPRRRKKKKRNNGGGRPEPRLLPKQDGIIQSLEHQMSNLFYWHSNGKRLGESAMGEIDRARAQQWLNEWPEVIFNQMIAFLLLI